MIIRENEIKVIDKKIEKMKERAINKIKAKITQKELDLKQSLKDKKNKIGFLNEEQYDSLIRHNHKEIKIYEYILNKIQ